MDRSGDPLAKCRYRQANEVGSPRTTPQIGAGEAVEVSRPDVVETETADQSSIPVRPRDWRVHVWWGMAFGVLLCMAAVCMFVLMPYMEVRAAVKRCNAFTAVKPEEEVKNLGGPEKTVAKCSLFVRSPEWLATRNEKVDAMSILVACGPAAIPKAEDLLHSSDPFVRRRAVVALGQLHALCSMEALICALRDANPSVRAAAASVLGDLRDTRAVGPLTAVLSDKNEQVSIAAAEALAKLQGADVPANVNGDVPLLEPPGKAGNEPEGGNK